MTMNRNSLISGFLTVAILATSVMPAFALFDEGMYMPDKIATIRDLKKRGLKLKPEEIYNPAGGGLTESVIRLSIGCTGEFVSSEGLILTNHHCGFDAFMSHLTSRACFLSRSETSDTIRVGGANIGASFYGSRAYGHSHDGFSKRIGGCCASLPASHSPNMERR